MAETKYTFEIEKVWGDIDVKNIILFRNRSSGSLNVFVDQKLVLFLFRYPQLERILLQYARS